SGLDLKPFFNSYIFGTETFDYNTVFNYANYDAQIMDKKRINIGISLSNNYIKSVTRNTSAYLGCLNVGDEIIAVNGFRFNRDFIEFINNKKVRDKITVLVSRDEILQTIEIPLIESLSTSFSLTKKDEPENEVYKKWLRKL